MMSDPSYPPPGAGGNNNGSASNGHPGGDEPRRPGPPPPPGAPDASALPPDVVRAVVEAASLDDYEATDPVARAADGVFERFRRRIPADVPRQVLRDFQAEWRRHAESLRRARPGPLAAFVAALVRVDGFCRRWSRSLPAGADAGSLLDELPGAAADFVRDVGPGAGAGTAEAAQRQLRDALDAAAQKTPRPFGDAGAEVAPGLPLDDDHRMLLRILAAEPPGLEQPRSVRWLLDEMSRRGRDRSDKTIKQRLVNLVSWKLAERPDGPGGRVIITAEGRRVADRLPRN